MLKSTSTVWNIPAMSATEFIGLLILLETTSVEVDVQIFRKLKITVLFSEPVAHFVFTEEVVYEDSQS